MRSIVVGFAVVLLVSGAGAAEEVVWKATRDRKAKIVYEGGRKTFNWSWSRRDPGTVASFSAGEKRWMGALFPGAGFRLLREPGEAVPDEYLVLADRRVVSKDDFFAVEAGGDGAKAVAFVIRAPDGLVPGDGGEPVDLLAAPPEPEAPPPPPSPTVDLEAYLYMEDPPPLPPAPEPEPEPEPAPPPPPPEPVDRFQVAGEVRFHVLKESQGGAVKILYHARSTGPVPAVDLLRFRSFPFGKGRAFGVAYTWMDEAEGPAIGYELFTRGPWGIDEAWSSRVLRFPEDPMGRRGVRFRFKDVDAEEGAETEPELLVQDVNLSGHAAPPDAFELLPPAGVDERPAEGTGVVRILRFHRGTFKMVGWADRAKGDRPVALRKNWPNYLARQSPGPSLLLSFGQESSPFEAYPCPWPDHPPREVPWLKPEYLYKGKEHRAGPGDVELAVWTLHDARALYVMAVVRDDALVLPGLDRDPALGDHLQLWLDPRYGDEALMLEVFPGAPPGAGAMARVGSPVARRGPAPRVRVAARPFQDGYWLEVAVPYSYLEDEGLPPEGSLWGMALNVVDVDVASQPGRKTVLSTSKDFRWARPETFNNLILE